MCGLSISRAPLQASTSSSCARSGKPSRTRNSSSFHEPRRILTLPARHCELNGPNRVSLSPLSVALGAPDDLCRSGYAKDLDKTGHLVEQVSVSIVLAP